MNRKECRGCIVAGPNKGITLIALVITIIIMLILAGITLNLTLGERGIVKTAIETREEYNKSQIKEEIEFGILDIEQEEIAIGNELTLEIIKEKLPSKLNNITAEISEDKIVGIYKGYDYEIDNQFYVTIGKNNGSNIDQEEEETKGIVTISKDLQMWLDATKEKITLQDILSDETIGEVKGLIPIIIGQDVTRTQEDGMIKYTDTTGGIISTNSEYTGGGSYAYMAFDGTQNDGALSEIGKAANYWLEYEFKENVKAICAKIRITTGSGYYGERTYKVQAYNEEENKWDDLTNEVTHTGSSDDFPVDILALNTTKLYKKFRIYVTSIGNSTGYGSHLSGARIFQLYGMKTNNNSIPNEQIEQKVILSSNLNIELSNAVNIDSLMERMMHKKETEELIFTNENIRNAVMSSEVALSKTKGLIPIITPQDVTRTQEDGMIKYTDTTGGIISTNSEYTSIGGYAYLAFNGTQNNCAYSNYQEANNYWLEYEFKENVKAIYAKIRITTGSSHYGERTYKVQAYNEEENKWDDLTNEITHTGSSDNFPVDMLAFTNNKAYKKFRIYVTSIGNSTGYGSHLSGVRIFQLYGIEEK